MVVSLGLKRLGSRLLTDCLFFCMKYYDIVMYGYIKWPDGLLLHWCSTFCTVFLHLLVNFKYVIYIVDFFFVNILAHKRSSSGKYCSQILQIILLFVWRPETSTVYTETVLPEWRSGLSWHTNVITLLYLWIDAPLIIYHIWQLRFYNYTLYIHYKHFGL